MARRRRGADHRDFLGGLIHLGSEITPAGRVGEAPSNALAERLRALDFASAG